MITMTLRLAYDTVGFSCLTTVTAVCIDITWIVILRASGIYLSVTPSCNLLVTCRGVEPNHLVEMDAASGQRMRDIPLHDIKFPWHSVQLTTGQFVVCHGFGYGSDHRVCVVGDNGEKLHSYGDQRGFDDGQLMGPHHLAVDGNSQRVFVADYYNGRIVELSPTLEFVRYASE